MAEAEQSQVRITIKIHTGGQLVGGGGLKSWGYFKPPYPLPKPIYHQYSHFYIDIFQFKKANGTPIERKVYSDLGLVGMVDRMINKRPLSFYGGRDKYLLRNGTKGFGKWELIGQQVNILEPYCIRRFGTNLEPDRIVRGRYSSQCSGFNKFKCLMSQVDSGLK